MRRGIDSALRANVPLARCILWARPRGMRHGSGRDVRATSRFRKPRVSHVGVWYAAAPLASAGVDLSGVVVG